MQQFGEAPKIFPIESCGLLDSKQPGLCRWTRIVREENGRESFPTEVRPDFCQRLLRFRMDVESPDITVRDLVH